VTYAPDAAGGNLKKKPAILLTGKPRNPRFLEAAVDGVQQAAGQGGYEVGSHFSISWPTTFIIGCLSQNLGLHA